MSAPMDRAEVVRLCAEAMGYRVAAQQDDGVVFYPHPNRSAVMCAYDPITNSAQAFELVERLEASITFAGSQYGDWLVRITRPHQYGPINEEVYNDDLRTAICECAAHAKRTARRKKCT